MGREPEGDHHIQHGNRHCLVTQQAVRMCVQVEDFWALYNHIELASRLAAGCDYSLFKEGVKPMWEDDRNKKGGRWLINLDKKQRASCLDNFWLEVVSLPSSWSNVSLTLSHFQMLCLIGESFDGESVIVNGAVVNVRNRVRRL